MEHYRLAVDFIWYWTSERWTNITKWQIILDNGIQHFKMMILKCGRLSTRRSILRQYQFSCSVVSNSLQLQHARLLTSGAYSNSCPSCWWWHPTISSCVVPFSSCLQSFPSPGSFPMNLFFASVGQSIGVSASTPVLPKSIQDWFPLGLTGWISLPSKRLSRVFSNTTVQKHRFFGAQLSLYSNSHIHTWLLEKR